MKLHHSVLLTLATCAAAGIAAAEDVTWDYTSNTTFNFAEGSTLPNIPADNGTITKTGSGVVTFDLGKNGATGPECDATASTYAGNVIINAGAIKFGNADGYTGSAWRVSPDVLGTDGSITVNSGAELQLKITQNGSVTFNKAITLNGGKLHVQDGNYTFAKPITLTVDSTLQNDWDKSHTFNGINAEGKKLTITRGNSDGTTQTFKGAVTVGHIEAGNGVNLVFNRSNNGLTSLSTGGITMGTNSRLDLHVTQNGNTNLGEVTLGGGNTIHMIDGHYTVNKLTQGGALTINSDWNKTFTVSNLAAEGKELTFFGTSNAYGPATLKFTGENNVLGTLNLNGTSELNVQEGSLTAAIINVANGTTLTDVTLTGTKVTQSGFTGGTLTDATFTAIASTSTFSGVTLAGTTTMVITDLGAIALSTDVASSVLSGATLTGSLDLGFSSDLVAAYASETPFSITFSGLDSTNATGITVSQEMLDSFGAMTVTQGADTVLSFAGTGTPAVPEPATATLSLLALAGLCARRRRK